MPLLIGACANSASEGTEYATDTYYNNLIPDYVEPSDIQEWVNLQEQIRLFQAEDNLCNIKADNNKFSWKSLLIHGLRLSGHIQQEYQQLHSLPSVSHQRSGPIIDNGIRPYHYYEAPYSNLSDINILYDKNTISSSLQNDISTHEQGVSSGTVEAEHTDIINKEPKTIDIFESLGERQHAKSSADSYIEVDQEVTMPIVVATYTTLMSKGWKYCLGVAGAALAGAGIYAGYKWIMGNIGSSEKGEVLLPVDIIEEEAPQTAMLRSGEKHFGSKSKYDTEIRNSASCDFTISTLQFTESQNSHEPSENKFCITLDDLQYDNITAKDSKLELQDAITSSMNRDFYNRYFYPYVLKVFSNTEPDINKLKQDIYNNIINDLINITSSTHLLSVGGISYVNTIEKFLINLIKFAPSTHFDQHRLVDIDDILSQQRPICRNYQINLNYNNFYNDTLTSLVISTTSATDVKPSYKLDNNFLQLRSCISNITVKLLDELHNNPKFVTDNLLLDLVGCRNNISNIINVQFKHLEYNSKYTWNVVTSNIRSPINTTNINKTFYDIFSSIIIYCRVLPRIDDMVNISFDIQSLIDQNYKSITSHTARNEIISNTESKSSILDPTHHPLVFQTSTEVPFERNDHYNFIAGGAFIIPIPFCTTCSGAAQYIDDVSLEDINENAEALIIPVSEEPESHKKEVHVPKMQEFIALDCYLQPEDKIPDAAQAAYLNKLYKGNKWVIYPGHLEYNFKPESISSSECSFCGSPSLGGSLDSVAIVEMPGSSSSGGNLDSVVIVEMPGSPNDDVPDNILQTQIKIKYAIRCIEFVVPTVLELLRSLDFNVQDREYVFRYFAGALGTYDQTAITESIKRIKLIVENIDEYMKYAKNTNYNLFTIVTGPVSAVEEQRGYEFQSVLEHEIHTCAYTRNGYNEITVISELAQIPCFENKIHKNDRHNLYETLLHEISHIVAETEDILYTSLRKNGVMPNALTMLNKFNRYIETHENSLHIKIYRLAAKFKMEHKVKMHTTDLAKYLLNHDPVFKSNVMMCNADNIEIIIRDLAARRAYDVPEPNYYFDDVTV